ncbi:MAG: diguanylate cyclase [Demequinaceae bacterium]|nr:diguanylate cyclase [Demequinaceae bacterium]
MDSGTQWWSRAVVRRLAFLLACTVVVAVFTLSALAFFIVKARAQVSAADDAALSSATDTAQQLVSSYVGQAESVSRDMSGSLAAAPIPFDLLDEELLRQLQVHHYVRAITVTYPDGAFVIARWSGDGFVTRVVDPLAVPSQTFTTYDSSLAVQSVSHATVDFPITTAPSYLAAVASQGVQWTEPALRSVTKRPGVWAAMAARDANGDVLAVVAADIYAESLVPALEGFALGEAGEAFILGADRSVVAAPLHYDDAIVAYADAYGLVAPAAALGVGTTAVAKPLSTESVFGTSGDLVTLERGFGEGGPPWVIHMQANPATINPALAQIANGLTVPLVAGIIAFLLVVWSAFTARSVLVSARRRELTDRTSGLFTVKALAKLAPRQIRRIKADDRVLCVAVLSVDDLGWLAKTRGVFAQEAALHAVGDIIKLETRADDTAVRHGASEFAVLMSLASSGDASVAVERIRAHVADALSLRFGSDSPLDVRAGFAMAPAGRPDVGALIESAQEALSRGGAPAGGRPAPSRAT